MIKNIIMVVLLIVSAGAFYYGYQQHLRVTEMEEQKANAEKAMTESNRQLEQMIKRLELSVAETQQNRMIAEMIKHEVKTKKDKASSSGH